MNHRIVVTAEKEIDLVHFADSKGRRLSRTGISYTEAVWYWNVGGYPVCFKTNARYPYPTGSYGPSGMEDFCYVDALTARRVANEVLHHEWTGLFHMEIYNAPE